MGKSENGAIWLDENFLSAYDYWQFWRNTDDRDVLKFLKNFTDIEIEDIKKANNLLYVSSIVFVAICELGRLTLVGYSFYNYWL